jgi:uncharacterized protein involved in response to NO
LIFHLGALGVVADERLGLKLALYLVIVLIVVMGGRIIPAFTTNALRHRGETALPISRTWVEVGAVASVPAAAFADLAAEGSALAGMLALVAAALHAVRLAGWQSLRTGFSPILWVLHAGYLWVPLGFALQGLAAFTDNVPPSAALHALTAGAVGTLTLGVMSRVALGHTGRDIVAAPAIAIAYGLVLAAAAVRVIVPIVAPEAMLPGMVASGVLWILAFALFTIVYAPILIRPRVDGREG